MTIYYYYRGIEDGSPVYSRSREQPYMRRAQCLADAKASGLRAVFLADRAYAIGEPGLKPYSLHQPVRLPYWGSSGC